MTRKPRLLAAIAVLMSFMPAAFAEKADREKPINIEADRISIDDLNKIQTFDGNVILTQGTLQIRTAKLVVTQDADGFQKGVATGGGDDGLAHFRQKREGINEYIDGEAERIVHDERNDVTELFVRAWVRSGQDEVRGQYIRYNSLEETYLVTTGRGESKTATGATQARVKAIIQPKGKNAPPPEDKSEALELKAAEKVSPLAQ